MNHLLRELAPVPEEAWHEIEEEATRTVRHYLTARRLIDGGWMDGTRETADGRPWSEHAAEAREAPGQAVVAPLERPFKATGGLVILRGGLAPDGAVVKVAGHERPRHERPAYWDQLPWA